MPPRIDLEPSLGFRFVVNGLDRAAELREDRERLAALAADPRARFLVICGSRVVVARDGAGNPVAALDRATAEALAARVEERIFLGLATGDDGTETGWFAFAGPADPDTLSSDFEAIELRPLAIAGSLPAENYGAIAIARSLLAWHASHRHCARCGAPSDMATAGWRRLCPSCGAEHFPRTDPAVIMLVHRGDRCLLGRGHAFPPGMWSCLAGFVEPGETIEGAVRRETLEEAGIRVGAVAYVASEPWPFPGSLMIGVVAEADDETIRMDPAELEDCRWFTRDEVATLLAGEHPDGIFAPPPIAIAHHLLSTFVRGA